MWGRRKKKPWELQLHINCQDCKWAGRDDGHGDLCCWMRGESCERNRDMTTFGAEGRVCAGREGNVQFGLTQSHRRSHLHMGPKTNCENLRVLCTGNIQFFKAHFIGEYISSFFFFLNTKRFSKSIWRSQNNSQIRSWIRIISRFVTSQYIYAWFIRNRKILSPYPTNYQKQTEEKQL